MLFDTHAHMDDRAFDADREELLKNLPESGVGLLVNPGCSLSSSEAACALAKEYDYIYAAVGSHPDAADEVNEKTLDRYRQMVRENPKVVAIGEIGLDYHYEDIPRDIQKEAFRASAAEIRFRDSTWSKSFRVYSLVASLVFAFSTSKTAVTAREVFRSPFRAPRNFSFRAL